MLSLQSMAHIELAKIADDAGLLTTVAAHLSRAGQLDEHRVHTAVVLALQAQLATKEAVEELGNLERGIATVQERALALVAESAAASSADLRRGPLLEAGCLVDEDLFHSELFPPLLESRGGEAASQIERFVNIDAEVAAATARLGAKAAAAAAAIAEEEEGEGEGEAAGGGWTLDGVIDLWSRVSRGSRKSGDWDVCYASTKLAVYAIGLAVKAAEQGCTSAKGATAKQGAGKTGGSKERAAAGAGAGGAAAASNRTGMAAAEGVGGAAAAGDGAGKVAGLVREQTQLLFILGETAVQLLRSEGFGLMPSEGSRGPTGAAAGGSGKPPAAGAAAAAASAAAVAAAPVGKNGWAAAMTQTVFGAFRSAAELGVQIGQSLIVVNAGVYMWNYCGDLMLGNDGGIIGPFEAFKLLFAEMAKVEPKPRLFVWILRFTNAIGKVIYHQTVRAERELAAGGTSSTAPSTVCDALPVPSLRRWRRRAISPNRSSVLAFGVSFSLEGTTPVCLLRFLF
jgi:hypothetical protein